MTTSTAFPAAEEWDGNAYWNNTTGARNNGDSTAAPNNVNAYTNVYDKILSGTPYNSGVFTLNNTAGAGADCRGTAVPTTIGGDATSCDMGAIQATASGSAGGLFRNPSLAGT